MANLLMASNNPREDLCQHNKKGTHTTVTALAEDTSQDGEDEDHEESILTSLITSTHLISSPYQNPSNQLNLQSLDLPDRLFAIALSQLSPVRSDYATAAYLDAFNWARVSSALQSLCIHMALSWPKQEFYVVIFRSQLREGADRKRLGELDQRSHEEACASGGLLKYWFGSPDDERRNLATCIWSTKEDAAAGGAGPWHRQARAAAREMYERITFETYKLVIEADAKTWRLENHLD